MHHQQRNARWHVTSGALALVLAGCTASAPESGSTTPGSPPSSEVVVSPSAEAASTWPPKYALYPSWGRPVVETVDAAVPWTVNRSHDGYRMNQEIDLIGDWAAAFHDPEDPELVHIEVFAPEVTWDISPATLGHEHHSITSVMFSRAGEIAVVLSIYEEYYGGDEPSTILYFLDPDTGDATEISPGRPTVDLSRTVARAQGRIRVGLRQRREQ